MMLLSMRSNCGVYVYENTGDWKGYTLNAIMITSREGRKKGKDVMERSVHFFPRL